MNLLILGIVILFGAALVAVLVVGAVLEGMR